MIRNAFLALAVVAMVASANAAFAGGRSSGSSKSNNQYVRIKNTGTQRSEPTRVTLQIDGTETLEAELGSVAPGETVVVTGSVYLVGEVLERLAPERGLGEGRLQDF